jgi:hypothetical protein
MITYWCIYIYLYIGQFAKKLLQDYQVDLSDRATNVKKRILSEDAILDMISASKKNQNNDVIGFTKIVTTTTPTYKKGMNIYSHVICKKTSLLFFYILFIFVFSIEWRIFSSEIMQMYFKETISTITK